MAKKQTRRSISVSRGTYERLKAYCETNGMSMSQFVERRVGDFLGSTSRLPDSAPRTVHIEDDDAEPRVSTENRSSADAIFTF